jgi:hypothetical protein
MTMKKFARSAFLALAWLLASSTAFAQTVVTIDQLAPAAPITGLEAIPVFQGSNPAVKTTPAALALFSQGAVGNGGNPVTGNYTIAAGDCSTNLLAGTGSTGKFTLTLPSVSGFPAGCSVQIKNGDSTAPKALSGFPLSTSSTLWPKQSIGVKIINGAWHTFYNPGAYLAPMGGLPLYAAPAAIGSGSCLDSANACTLATACSFVTQIATFLGQAGPIQLADGTYSTVVGGALCTIQGDAGGSSSQLVSIQGNAVTPTNVVLAVPNSIIGILIQDMGLAGTNNLEFTLGTNSYGIQCRQLSVCDYNTVYWGASGAGSAHVAALGNAVVNMSASETILANFAEHWSVDSGSYLTASGNTAIPSAVTWTQFIAATSANVNLGAWTYSGSGASGSSGSTFAGTGNGRLVTPGGLQCSAAGTFPGNGTCSFNQGYQDSFGDGITGGGILVGQNGPTITDPILTAHTYAGLPGSPTAGQISHIIDGLATNCGDTTCTTPGATVTGGGGALDLLVGWDGAAWRIFRAQSVPALANLSGTLAVNKGGTGNATAAAHSIPVSEGVSVQAAVGPCTTSQVIVGAGASADPACGAVPAAALPSAAPGLGKVTAWRGGYVTGRYYIGEATNLNSTLAMAANTVYFIPVVVGETHTFDRIAVNVTATGTAVNLRPAIYNAAGGVPTSLVADGGNISASGTGLVAATISQALAPGIYWLAIVADGTVTITATSSTQGSAAQFSGLSSFATPDLQLNAAMTLGAYPANAFTGAMGAVTYSASSPPVLGLRG